MTRSHPNPARKIAVVGACPYPAPQGSQIYMRDTARALKSLGHDLRLVVYGHGVGEAPEDIPVHRCPNVVGARRIAAGPSPAKPVLDAFMVSTLRRVVKKFDVDLVNAHNYEALLVALAARVRPIVYHAHNAMTDELPHYTRAKTLSRGLGKWLDTFFPHRADRIVAPHTALADYLIGRGCTSAQIAVIPPSVDAAAFDSPIDRIDAPPVLYTGNLDAYQNMPFLFRVMERVREKSPAMRLVIATASNAKGRKLPGFVDLVSTPDFAALPSTLSRDAVFVSPRVSWSGYPIKLLNAMAAGQAIVCCKSAAHPVTHDHDGIVVPDGDETAFSDAVLELLQNPVRRAELGANARETVSRNHHPNAHARDLSRVIESCRT